MKKIGLSTLFTLLFLQLFAQNQGDDFMRSIGHIYVVVGVIFIIFIGIILFLIRLDRKISALEKNEQQR